MEIGRCSWRNGRRRRTRCSNHPTLTPDYTFRERMTIHDKYYLIFRRRFCMRISFLPVEEVINSAILYFHFCYNLCKIMQSDFFASRINYFFKYSIFISSCCTFIMLLKYHIFAENANYYCIFILYLYPIFLHAFLYSARVVVKGSLFLPSICVFLISAQYLPSFYSTVHSNVSWLLPASYRSAVPYILLHYMSLCLHRKASTELFFWDINGLFVAKTISQLQF